MHALTNMCAMCEWIFCNQIDRFEYHTVAHLWSPIELTTKTTRSCHRFVHLRFVDHNDPRTHIELYAIFHNFCFFFLLCVPISLWYCGRFWNHRPHICVYHQWFCWFREFRFFFLLCDLIGFFFVLVLLNWMFQVNACVFCKYS